MNKFENFVRENRDGFDNEMPSLELRDKILNSVRPKKRNKRRVWLVAAAISAITLVNIALVGYNMAIKTSIEKSISKVAPDYREADKFYTNRILVAKKNLANSSANEEVLHDLESIDKMIQELKEELKIAPKDRKKQLINKIIAGYRSEIQILERVKERTFEPKIKVS